MAGRCSAISRKAGLHHTSQLLGKTKHHNSECPPLLSSSPSFICWAWHHMVWNIPWVSWGQLFWLCPLPTSCAPPASLLVGWGEKKERPCLSVSPAQQELKHPCVINTVYSTNPKHSPTLATMEKINPIPAKTSTIFNSTANCSCVVIF